jgi:hypothetical protein
MSLPVMGQVSWVKQKSGEAIPRNALLAGSEHAGENEGLRGYVCRVAVKDGF